MQTAVRERLELEADLRGAVGSRGARARLPADRGARHRPHRGGRGPAPVGPPHAGPAAARPSSSRRRNPRGPCRPSRDGWSRRPADAPASGRCSTTSSVLPLLTVNATARLLASADFVQTVERALAASGLPAGRLVLELTEGAAVEDAPTTFRAMRRLRSAGVRVAIDDFGTGYSSLSYLRDMPVDILKLDKLFVDERGRRVGRAPADPRASSTSPGRSESWSWPRGSSARSRPRACASTAARSARGSSSRDRSRRTSCGSASRPTRPCAA